MNNMHEEMWNISRKIETMQILQIKKKHDIRDFFLRISAYWTHLRKNSDFLNN